MWKLAAIFLVVIPAAATVAAVVFRRWWLQSPQGRAAMLRAEQEFTLKLHARLEGGGKALEAGNVEDIDLWRRYWSSPEFDRLMDTAKDMAAGHSVDPTVLEIVKKEADAVREGLGLPERPNVR